MESRVASGDIQRIYFPLHTQDFTHFADREPIICFKFVIGKNVASKNDRSIDINQIVENIFPIGLCPHFSMTPIQPLPPSRN
ncbi:hypothetical protein [Paraburkholderia sp. C35]|uniref:hypothetical protein n=1 Tax=Paraburkholderia sp. C35 TaxID=2126993 RepID=UPI0013A5AE0F|nr:hypothetical protein [Paraburkholderia sp. C35]